MQRGNKSDCIKKNANEDYEKTLCRIFDLDSRIPAVECSAVEFFDCFSHCIFIIACPMRSLPYDVVALGFFRSRGGYRIREVSFSLLFPVVYYNLYDNELTHLPVT